MACTLECAYEKWDGELGKESGLRKGSHSLYFTRAWHNEPKHSHV